MKKFCFALVLALMVTALSAQNIDTIKLGTPWSQYGLSGGEKISKAWLKVNDHIQFTNAAVYPVITVKSSIATGKDIFNVVDYDLNKVQTTWAEKTDTSSFSLKYSYTGSPTLKLTSKAGVTITKADSANITQGVPMIVYIGDTTVTAKYGVVVFKTSDSTFYGCRYIRPTGKKKWWPLDH